VKRYLVLIVALATLTVGWGASVAQGDANTTRTPQELTPLQQAILRGGVALPKNPSLLREGKAAAQARAGRSAPAAAAPGPSAPAAFVSWAGINDENVTPSDSTGAIGPTRYVELINQRFAIYSRVGGLLSGGTLSEFAGRPVTDDLFDVQVIWDPGTQRFYYAMDNVVGGTFLDNQIAFGWSKDASPTTSADWCKYSSDFGLPGDLFPDYPKLGDMNAFMLIGVNNFDPPAFSFTDASLLWFAKPGPGTTCPAIPGRGNVRNLKDEDGSQTFTPVPANQTDNALNGTSVVVSVDPYGTPRNFMTRFRVSPGLAGPVVENPGRSIPISSFSFPANAAQSGTTKLLDTLDGRLTNAVMAGDPRLLRTAVWTQHTVSGGAGSEVRWYEVDPNTRTVLQSGAATSSARYAFNGAISPDRANNGTSASFGSNMVMGFNTSSTSEFVNIQMISKLGANAQSGFVLVQASPGFNQDFSCDAEPVCRWGDYSGATPDPTPPAGPTGAVWQTNAWNDASATSADTDWRTWNWGTTP
jgi:hypothetical protein